MGLKNRFQPRTEKRSERVELRITPAHRSALERVALEKRRTVSSLIAEWIETLIKGSNDAD